MSLPSDTRRPRRKRRFHSLIPVALAPCLVLLLALSFSAAQARVTVTHTTYKGWTDAYRLSNKTVDVVVVPGIGRIMAFGFTGSAETSPLFNNRAELGRPAVQKSGVYPNDWINYGGDKLWPSQQIDWFRHQPKAWPPDPNFDEGPYRVSRIRSGLRLTGPVSPYYQIQVVREITLPPHGARVYLRDTFRKSPDAAGRRNGFPVGIWSISQVRGDATIYLPLNRRGLFPGVGLTSLGDKPTLLPNWRARGDTVAVTRPNNVATKMGVDDAAGWMACIFGGDLLFSERFTRRPRALYPDKGCNAEVYTNGDPHLPYIEMEVLSRMVRLRAGQTLTRTMSWRLQRLPRWPRSDADARRLVVAAMAGR
ncbi:MAG: DUF4380 domain-containing protein [Armatimonadetes bacterium]|nr:DUF4380 domain-containing protein [Armatimonadota bacterium]